jgi:hypothetical protein
MLYIVLHVSTKATCCSGETDGVLLISSSKGPSAQAKHGRSSLHITLHCTALHEGKKKGVGWGGVGWIMDPGEPSSFFRDDLCCPSSTP